MKRRSFWLPFVLGLLWVLLLPLAWPGLLASQGMRSPFSTLTLAQKPPHSSSSPRLQFGPSESSQSDNLQPFEAVIGNAQKLDGLFTLYQKDKTGKLYAEIRPEQLNVNYLLIYTLASGIGERGLYSGLPLGNYLFYWQRVNQNLQLTIRNVNFRTRPGDPLARSLSRSFSDSVLYSLPIQSIHPQRQSLLVDLGDMLLSDLPDLSGLVKDSLGGGYALDSRKSYLGEAKAFPQNVELESVYNFLAGSAPGALTTLPDERGFTLRVRYSLSQLPSSNHYRPRLADERVGYFLTAYQDFSDDNAEEPFVRYINRWHLEKQNPAAPLSRPKQPIVFWIENTVPKEYRQAVREGVLLWNSAFEKIGFQDAIEVKQMPDRADWDPADVRYNTIRWFNSIDASVAIGPSRVNPLTGQILDADILVDANFVRAIKQQYRFFAEPLGANSSATPSTQAGPCTNLDLSLPTEPAPPVRSPNALTSLYEQCYGIASAQHLAVGQWALTLLQNAPPNSKTMQTYVHQFIRALIAHEVGHTLGLRHNFHGSTLLSPEDLHNPAITQAQGLTASVMDYMPPNLAPPGMTQGDYFTTKVGPYDDWAIAYGYTPLDPALPETRTLEKIAQRAPEAALSYGTDEDAISALDPDITPFDLSQDPLTYAQWQMDNAQAMWRQLEKSFPNPGKSYTTARDAFEAILGSYLSSAIQTTRYVGGQALHRDRAGDPNGRPPFQPIPLAQQRRALSLLQTYVFDASAFHFPPDLLNRLAPSRWAHWGSIPAIDRLDYPIHDRVFFLQQQVLRSLLSDRRLSRLRDNELKAAPSETLTLPELFATLQQGIWSEILTENSGPVQISSLRRTLQQEYLNLLGNLITRSSQSAEDIRTLAWYHLRQLQDPLDRALHRSLKDTYTQAHLEMSRDRIRKLLDAQIQLKASLKTTSPHPPVPDSLSQST